MSANVDLEQRLRDALGARADTFALAHPDEPQSHEIGPRQRVSSRRVVLVAAALAVAVLVAGGIWLSGAGDHPAAHHSLATGPTATHGPSSKAPVPRTTPSGAGLHGIAPYPVPSCPPDVTVPTITDGRFCGPPPSAGNGAGPDGVCTGQETTAPCGSGVTVGQYYDYTMPGQCNGLINFDGQRWVSELPPSTPVPSYDVWMSISAAGAVRYISPTGDVSFVLYTGQPLHQCSGTPTTTSPSTA